MERRILGLDPGLATVGFGSIVVTALEKVPRPRLVEYGTIETPARTEISRRLRTIHDDLHELIAELKPDLVALEKLFFYRMSTTIPVAQARGVLMLVLAQSELPFVEFTPAQIKQSLTGYGNADKQAVQQAVLRELELDKIPRPDDAADALAVAIAAWMHQI